MVNTADCDALLDEASADLSIESVPLVRPIAVWADARALWVLYWRFRRGKVFAVHTVTPKAGLVGMLAVWLARVPLRVHSFTGQVWVTRRGVMRWLLKSTDKCIAAMAADVLVDSPSQRNFLIQQRVITAKRSSVLGKGSISGVNIQRFCPDLTVRMSLRAELGSDRDTSVCLYLGRLNRDKGVLDLASAFGVVSKIYPQAERWVVGPDEADWFSQMQIRLGEAIHKVKRVGFTLELERFMQAADLFCLPSYREGFGSSVIEAASCGVPALVSRIYGLTDAVVENRTGWMREADNVQDLALKLGYVLSSSNNEIKRMGDDARLHAQQVFAQEYVTGAMLGFYEKRLAV